MTEQKTGQNGGAVLKTQVHYTADLLRSLQESIHRLRNEAEELREQLETNGAEEMTGAKGQISKLDGLIRDCQKVGKTIAEQSSDFARMLNSENELDFDTARRDVESRLADLRGALYPDDVSG